MDKLNTDTVFDLEYFFEITPDWLCIAGFDGYFKKINPAVSVTLGYSDEELFTFPINSFIHPDDREFTDRQRLRLTEGHFLLNFENRYLTKAGSIVWLSWTSVPIARDRLVFCIAKNVTYRKRIEEYTRISNILERISEIDQRKIKTAPKGLDTPPLQVGNSYKRIFTQDSTHADQLWLNHFETFVRAHAGKSTLNLDLISDALAVSQRQLFRRVASILDITPNKLVRIIRLQLAWEAIVSGRYRTIKEISSIAGYHSRSYFSKLFKEIYGIHVSDLL